MALFSYTVHPSDIFVSSINVSDTQVKLSGTFTSSAVWYRNYKAEYNAGTLYIKIRGSNIELPHTSGDFNINITNTYGKITKVILSDDTPQGNIQIWPKK